MTGDVLFNRNWDAYRRGFGDVSQDYWIGLDAIHELCNEVCEFRLFRLRVRTFVFMNYPIYERSLKNELFK